MTEYVTPMISTVLKKYQTSATKSLQGPGHALTTAGVLDIVTNGRSESPGLNGKCQASPPVVALIKKEILSSPEPQDLQHHECSTRGTPPQIYSPATPPRELSQPILSVADAGCGELYETKLEGKTIGCFSVGGEMRLCLPQFLNNVLNDFSLEQINRIFDELGIYCSQCTHDQLVEFKAAKILPSDVKASGLITRTDAERLCAALLHRSDRNSYVPIESLAKGALSFHVYHKCFGKCEGICTPDMYSYQKPTCIKCLECDGWFSPQKFVGHVHRKFENHTCHWGFDSRNWHDYLHVALDVENREKYQIILDQLKEVELKEMHKAQRELEHKKRKAEMLMDDGLLGSGPVLGLAGHPHGLVGALAPPPPPPMKQPQMDIPSGKKQMQQLKGATVAASALEYQYQVMYAHCVQKEREREREHLPHSHPLPRQHRAVLVATAPYPHLPQYPTPPTLNSSSAFRPWGPDTTKAFLHAYGATLSSLPYACQEPPELQNPERVVRSTDKRYAERTYQPNVALAPRKSILSKERDKDRERMEREVMERQRLREKETDHQVVHIKQERSQTPTASPPEGVAAPLDVVEPPHPSSSGSNSPLPAHLPAAPATAPPNAGGAPPTPTNLRNMRSPEEFSAGGSNEITSSTSPHHQQSSHHQVVQPTAGAPPPSQHIIATVNQHAKLLPSSSSLPNGNGSSSLAATNNEPSRIRINKNLMSQQPVVAVSGMTPHHHQHHPTHMHHFSHGYYKSQASSPTQSSSAGLNLSTHSSNVVSSPHHATQPKTHHNSGGPGNHGLQNGKPHLGSEFELSTDTDDTDSLNGEPDSSAMLPPWEQAVESLRETRPKDRERVLLILQRLLQENDQYRYNNIQLSELLHKQDAHIADLTDQLQRYRRQFEEQVCKVDLRKMPFKHQTRLENVVEAGRGEAEEDDELEEEEMEDRANNNNQQELSPLIKAPTNGLRRSVTPTNCSGSEGGDCEKPDEPESKRIKLQVEEKTEDKQVENEESPSNGTESHDLDKLEKNADKADPTNNPKSPQPSQISSDEEMEEDEDEDEEDEDEEVQVEAPHSSALATPPTATTPLSPDSAATAGQLFDSSNSSDESSMKKAQMSACHALEKMSSNVGSDETNPRLAEESQEEEAEEDPEEDDSDDDEMPLQQRQQQQRQRVAPQSVLIGSSVAGHHPAPPHPPMATKASKKQTPPAPPTAAATTTASATTNCELQIKKEIA
ncbi:histone-lysine N-methyltransferase SETD1A [Drosophila sechellia]|nr:histone-lysine N-methyltransferase SETD1A [Drosophila sechellia]